jgi:hypothetical protein
MSNEEQKYDRSSYRGYRGLPPLVGLLPMSEAIAKGLSVADSVARLKRLHWALRSAHELFVFKIAAEPIYELKMAYSLHAHYCAEHVAAIAARIREMRQPPYELDVLPAEELDLVRKELLSAPTTEAFVLGMYGVLVPEILKCFEMLLGVTNKLFDHPTVRLSRFALLEVGDINEYGQQAIACLTTDAERKELQPWIDLLHRALNAAGGLDGSRPVVKAHLEPHFSKKAAEYNGVPGRDERFKDSFNMGVNAEAMLFDPTIEPQPKTLMLFFKRMREIDVPEMMSSILAQTHGKPWEYYRDMTRQMWDEARHAMMGEIGFVSLGINWSDIPFNFTWALDLNTKLTPIERHAVLFTIEQGLMPKKIGKEFEWEVAVASASPVSALIQDYDWADEILHARIGRDWLVAELGSQNEAMAYGDRAWSRTAEDWAKWREQGLTKHANWWPGIYRQACKSWGVQPDPDVLAYDKTYQGTRSDQKQIS